ncbi:MAG: hypothetical protein GY861_19565 [bacterium]|nr:hypothetical protein [bacterium]
MSKIKLPAEGITISNSLKYFMAILIVILILDLLLGPKLKYLSVVLVFIIIGAASTFYYRFFEWPIGFELVKLVTILSVVAYSPTVGILVGLISTILGRIISGSMNHRALVSLLGIVVLAVLASVFSSMMEIMWLGIFLVVLYQIIVRPFNVIMGDSILYASLNAGTNIIFNVILFSKVAPYLLPIITAS